MRRTILMAMAAVSIVPFKGNGEMRVIADVPYSSGCHDIQRGDLYLPGNIDRRTQMVLLIHGGGWTSMSRHDVVGIAEFFAKDLGFAVYNIDYRLISKDVPWPACGDDCVKAAEFLLKGSLATEHGLHYDRIWICGGSAGGHLALWTLTHLPRHKVAGCISISSIGDPSPYLESRDWLCRKLYASKDLPRRMDPRPSIRPGMAPLLCTHATEDAVVPIASHKAFADAYASAGNRVEFYEYPSGMRAGLTGHGIWIPGSKPHRLIPEIEARIRAFVRPRMDLICVYYPHWHRYPKGDEWFGAARWKEGEWCFVKDAIPRFPGHRQPMVPQLGYLNGADPSDVAKEIDLAADAGIDVFLYDYYYYNGQITQEEAVEKGFLKAPNRSRMKFALMWCYHERNMGWRARPGEKAKRLMTLANTTEEFLGLIRYCREHYFGMPEYYRKDGKIFFSIYNGWKFVGERGNDVARVRSDLEKAREVVRAAGLGEIHFNVQNPEDRYEMDMLARCGFDSATHYNPNRAVISARVKARGGNPLLLDYSEVLKENRNRWREMSKAAIPYIPNLSTGWDSTPRCRLDEPFPWRKCGGTYTFTITNASPEVFRIELAAAKKAAEEAPLRPGAVYVNGWNEYTEGTYLVPDNFHGDGFLRAVEAVFGKNKIKKKGRTK